MVCLTMRGAKGITPHPHFDASDYSSTPSMLPCGAAMVHARDTSPLFWSPDVARLAMHVAVAGVGCVDLLRALLVVSGEVVSAILSASPPVSGPCPLSTIATRLLEEFLCGRRNLRKSGC